MDTSVRSFTSFRGEENTNKAPPLIRIRQILQGNPSQPDAALIFVLLMLLMPSLFTFFLPQHTCSYGSHAAAISHYIQTCMQHETVPVANPFSAISSPSFLSSVNPSLPYKISPPALLFTPAAAVYTPNSLLPSPNSLLPTPCSLLPTPYSLLLTPYTLHLTPYTLHLTPYSLLPSNSSLSTSRYSLLHPFHLAPSLPHSLAPRLLPISPDHPTYRTN